MHTLLFFVVVFPPFLFSALLLVCHQLLLFAHNYNKVIVCRYAALVLYSSSCVAFFDLLEVFHALLRQTNIG